MQPSLQNQSEIELMLKIFGVIMLGLSFTHEVVAVCISFSYNPDPDAIAAGKQFWWNLS